MQPQGYDGGGFFFFFIILIMFFFMFPFWGFNAAR